MNKIVLEEDKLKLLLEQRRDYISAWTSSGSIIGGLSFSFTGITSEFPGFGEQISDIIRLLMVIIGIALVIFGLYAAGKNHTLFYNHKKLRDEIMGLDAKTHRFSIVVIKDTYNEYPNRYLLHYDPLWKCDLFFSFKTLNEGNEDNIITRLSNLLNIDKNLITLEYKAEELQTKYSESDKVVKVYDHKYYLANISDFPDAVQADKFTVSDENCRWLSIRSMLEDKRIKDVNGDVVRYVRDYVG